MRANLRRASPDGSRSLGTLRETCARCSAGSTSAVFPSIAFLKGRCRKSSPGPPKSCQGSRNAHAKDVARAREFAASVAPEVRAPLEHWFSGTLAALEGDHRHAVHHRASLCEHIDVDKRIFYLAAMVDALDGNADGAIALLAQSVAKREPQASCANVDPTFHAMRQHAGFKSVIRSMNLPTH